MIKLDAVACPLNIESTDYELSQLLDLIEPDLLVGTQRSQSKSRLDNRWDGRAASFDELMDGSQSEIIAQRDAENELVDVAVILCTSGTTGLPKAAMLTSENITSNLEAFRGHLERFEGRDLAG